MSDLVTGEAVLLDLRPAGFASRALSGLVDVTCQVLLLLGVIWVAGALLTGLDQAMAAAVSLVLTVAVIVGLPVLVETLTRGRTLGKLAMGLRTVRDDGGPIRFRQAFVRALVEVVEVWILFGVPALISSLASERGKRLGDLAAGTYVVRERSAAQGTPPVTMPPELAPWAALADVGRLPDGLALAVRQFLGRRDGLHPASRHSLGLDLATRVSPYVAPPPPPGTPPEAFLAAVLVRRRDRDVARLAREDGVRRRLLAPDPLA